MTNDYHRLSVTFCWGERWRCHCGAYLRPHNKPQSTMRHTRTSNTISGALRSLCACGAITQAERVAYERDLANPAASPATRAELVARFGMRDASDNANSRVTFSVPTARGLVSTYTTAAAA